MKARHKWSGPYCPEPVVSQSAILYAGLAAFALALLWPPLLLLAAYLASKLVPYSYRRNDEGSARRRLYREFSRAENGHPKCFSSPPDSVRIRESYWVNGRCVYCAFWLVG
jgi:hypothetical protein